jgi:hypothetical protein
VLGLAEARGDFVDAGGAEGELREEERENDEEFAYVKLDRRAGEGLAALLVAGCWLLAIQRAVTSNQEPTTSNESGHVSADTRQPSGPPDTLKH